MAFERNGLENEGAREGRFCDNGTEFGVVTEGAANHQKEGRQRGADGVSGEDGGSDLEAGKGQRKGKKGIKGAEASVKVERNHRENRGGRNRGVTSSSESGSASGSESENAKSRRKGKAKTSGTKSRGGKNGRGKRVRDSESESTSDSECDRKKRKERSRDRSRDRSSRRKHRSSKKREREESGSDSETGSDSEDRRRRDRRKKKEKKEKKRRHRRERAGKRRDATGLEEMEGELETETGRELGQPDRSGVNRQQEAARQAAEDLKQTMRQNVEVARARLAGEVESARAQQMAMQNQFGAVDGRAVKKLNAEKRKLKSMVKAGHKLEALEAKEAARMDAFRIAMGLPTAEAQRQAEWRAEATQQAALLHATSAHAMLAQEPATPRRTLGPAMPGSKHKTSHD